MEPNDRKVPRITIDAGTRLSLGSFLRELLAYRDLFFTLVKRDIVVLYKQTVFGFAWAIVVPLFQMVIFAVIFGRLLGVPSQGVPYPIFAFAALVPWNYFSSAVGGASNSLIQNTAMFTKVYFPRVILPATPICAKLADFAISGAIMVLLLLYYGRTPGWSIAVLPLLIAILLITALGMGLWLSALSVQFRDIRHTTTVMLQMMMYAAPVVWPATKIPEAFRLYYGLYPMAGVIDGFRSALLGSSPISWDLITVGGLSSIVMLVSGYWYFRRTEYLFADVA